MFVSNKLRMFNYNIENMFTFDTEGILTTNEELHKNKIPMKVQLNS